VRLIVGIGNPGSRYKNNRHNVGFQFLDFFVQKKMLQFKASKFQFHITEGELLGQPFVLLKPDTYVNNSGLAVLDCINHFKIEVNDVLVVVDDINLASQRSGLENLEEMAGIMDYTQLYITLRAEIFLD